MMWNFLANMIDGTVVVNVYILARILDRKKVLLYVMHLICSSFISFFRLKSRSEGVEEYMYLFRRRVLKPIIEALLIVCKGGP